MLSSDNARLPMAPDALGKPRAPGFAGWQVCDQRCFLKVAVHLVGRTSRVCLVMKYDPNPHGHDIAIHATNVATPLASHFYLEYGSLSS